MGARRWDGARRSAIVQGLNQVACGDLTVVSRFVRSGGDGGSLSSNWSSVSVACGDLTIVAGFVRSGGGGGPLSSDRDSFLALGHCFLSDSCGWRRFQKTCMRFFFLQNV